MRSMRSTGKLNSSTLPLTATAQRLRSAVTTLSDKPAGLSPARCGLVCIVIFFCAHLAFLAGLTTPEKYVFDEVHYVPAALQMLGRAPEEPMLNPMHPPLAKQIIALSIRFFGDSALGWRYPATVFGALSVVAIYLCGLALFARQSAAVAGCLITFFNQMLFVQARIAMLDIFALGFALFGIAAFLFGYRLKRPHALFAAAGVCFGLSASCKWSGLFPFATAVLIVVLIRLMQHWRTQFADGNDTDWYRPELWPGFRLHHVAICFVALPVVAYLASFVVLYGFSLSDLLEAQRRIFADNTTTAIAGHTYMSSWPSWPFLIRPVWYLFDKVDDDNIAAIV